MGLWGPAWLEKPVDSMTRRLFPSPIFVFGPILGQLGPGELESRRAEAGKKRV